jgi:hypothetical protein
MLRICSAVCERMDQAILLRQLVALFLNCTLLQCGEKLQDYFAHLFTKQTIIGFTAITEKL